MERRQSMYSSELMGDHPVVGGITDPGYSLLCFHYKENIFNQPKQPIFKWGSVLPTNIVVASDGD